MVNNQTGEVDLHAIKEELSAHGLIATSQRLVIYQILLQHHDHPSADIVFERIKDNHPSISLATVYKTLDTLVQAGLAKKVKTGDDLLRFDAKTTNHSHLYCSVTNKIMDYEDDELQHLLESYFAGKNLPNFKIKDFQLQINGELIASSEGPDKLKQSK